MLKITPRTPGPGSPPDNLPPLTFHRVHGENVRVFSDGSIASRVREYYGNSIAFSARPIKVNEKVCLRFSGPERVFNTAFYFGFTSHGPATLAHSLPIYAYDFINKPGNWASIVDFRGELIFDYYVNPAGDVHFSTNGEDERLIFTGVDTKNPFWAFVDVKRNITAQFVAPRTNPPDLTSPPEQLEILTSTAAPLAGAGGTVLVDTSPPQNYVQNVANHQQGLTLASAHNFIEPIQASSQPCLAGQQPAEGNLTETECTICFDNPIDSALYACGHMFMCHTCAIRQWKGSGNGQCPQCRAEIIDVIRIYKP